MKRKRTTKTTSATQFTCSMGSLLRREIDGGGEHRADDHPQELVPIEEGHADEGRLELVVEGRPQHDDELDEEKQVPPAPPASLVLVLLHGDDLPPALIRRMVERRAHPIGSAPRSRRGARAAAAKLASFRNFHDRRRRGWAP